MRFPLFIASVALSALAVNAQEGDVKPVRTFVPYTGSVASPVDSPEVAPADTGLREGNIVLEMDPGVERVMSDYVDRKHAQQGYRVQIFLGDRRTAEDTKRSFLLKYPDRAAYLSWLAPNFRLRVGDLRTRLEAERLLREMKADYPGSYIVRDEIEPPPLPPQESN
jgi:hypothetical protein